MAPMPPPPGEMAAAAPPPPLRVPARFQCPLCFDVLRRPILLPCCRRHLWYAPDRRRVTAYPAT